MIRERVTERPGWQKRLEDAGFLYHKDYWTEDACYRLTEAEVDAIEHATTQIHATCLDLVHQLVTAGDYRGYGFPDEVKALVEESWRRKDPSLYGRMDLGFDGRNIKLFEYNADTPTTLPEAAVWQWHWLEDHGRAPRQFNSIHEQLVERWRHIAKGRRVTFAAMSSGGHDDWANVHYLAETAAEASLNCSILDIADIGWNAPAGLFVDMKAAPIDLLFKLYPWDWLMRDPFGWNVRKATKTQWIEPAWKLLLSSKAVLPHLWATYAITPMRAFLLPAWFDGAIAMTNDPAVRKPILGREGANVSFSSNAGLQRFGAIRPEYDQHGYVWQERMTIPTHDGLTPVIGSWVIGQLACGMGIREDVSPVTTNASRFVPHYYVE